MANPMDGFSLDYSGSRDDSQVQRDGDTSQIPLDPSLMGFANNYAFNAMLPQDCDLPLQSFDRPGPPGDLEGRLSNVMLTYDTGPSGGVSLPMNLDAGSAFTFDAPTTYPAISLGLTPSLDHSQLHNFSPFLQSLPQAGQYLQQQSAPQARKDIYNTGNKTGTNSTGSFEDSDFLRASGRSQPVQWPVQEQRYPQYGQPTPYRAAQPVAIKPKKPVIAKGKFPPGFWIPWLLLSSWADADPRFRSPIAGAVNA
jgi:pre-rRNA-processing protein SRD1